MNEKKQNVESKVREIRWDCRKKYLAGKIQAINENISGETREAGLFFVVI